MKKLILALGILITIGANAQYKWNNVRIGGGGYILGVYIHPNNPDLIYARTDVGGCYRYDPSSNKLIPLLDWIPFEKDNLYGVNGIALDPNDQNIVYASLGKYYGREGDVYKSTDKGKTWFPMNLNKGFGGNNHPSRQGTTMDINPHTGDLWVGTPADGLWKFNGNNWSQVSGVPKTNAVRSIAFDPNNSNYIYVASSYSKYYNSTIVGNESENGIYRSTNGGASFSKISISYQDNNQFSEISLSKNSDKMYVSCMQHDGSAAGLFVINSPRTSNNWSNITPESGSYRTVTASPHDNNVVITAKAVYGGINKVYYSTSSGSSWDRKNNNSVNNIVPWHPNGYPGSAISCFEWDPSNANKIYFSDWYSLYKTNNINASTVQWSNDLSRGHEEIVPALVIGAGPGNSANAILYAGGADVSGITQVDLDEYSSIPNYRKQVDSDLMQECSGIDFSVSDVDVVVAMGGEGWQMSSGGIVVSTDGGKTFSLKNGYSPSWGGGRVAISATDKNNILALGNRGGVKYSTDQGGSFKSSDGTSGTYGIGSIFNLVHPIASDRVNGDFYIYDPSTGDILRSTDKGASFSKRGNAGPKSGNHVTIVAAPAKAGHIWVANGKTLKYSTNGGASFNNAGQLTSCLMVALGKEKPGTNYPAIYAFAKKSGDSNYKYYASVDGGSTWVETHTNPVAGNEPKTMGADLNTYGTFYVATGGRGVFYCQLEEPVADLPNVAKPIVSPNGGTFTSTRIVSISTNTPGATIRYTTDGSTPTASSPKYTSTISISETTTIKAKGFKNGFDASETATAVFTKDNDNQDQLLPLPFLVDFSSSTGPWTTTSTGKGTFGVSDNRFVVRGNGGKNDTPVGIWRSKAIDISGKKVKISVSASGDASGLESRPNNYADYIDVFFSIDEGNEQLVGFHDGNFSNGEITIEKDNIGNGNSLQVIIKAKTTGEFFYFDNIMVKEDESLKNNVSVNNNPSINNISSIKIFPNPISTGTILKIILPIVPKEKKIKNNNIYIYDIMGKVVASKTIKHSENFVEIDSPSTAGIYILKVEQGTKTYNHKLIIK